MSDSAPAPDRPPHGRVLAAAGRWAEPALTGVAGAALVAGGIAWLSGARGAADACWAAATLAGLAPASVWVARALLRRRTGVDIVAVLALAGALAVGEYLAGAVIALMLGTGRWLERAAQRRASHDLRSLVERAPRSARLRTGTRVRTVPLAEVAPGDRVVVGPGEVVPVDGRVAEGTAVLDESALTGEPLQRERPAGDSVRSGAVNAGGAFELLATATAADSAFAEIVRLARETGARKAPVLRLADRYASWFVPVTLAVTGAAWLISGSSVRAVAVLVVATPCPLLLAAPVAVVSGLSRAARLGVVVRDGGALERLGHVRTVVLDKTGTLTAGRPRVTGVAAAEGRSSSEILRLAASVDQFSSHILAGALVDEARGRGAEPLPAENVTEEPGRGVTGVVSGHEVAAGKRPPGAALPGWAAAVENRAGLESAAVVWLTVDGALAGAVLLRDPLRPDAPRTVRRLREAGVERLLMVTGDRPEPAREIAAVVGLDTVHAGRDPAQKVAAVRAERERAVTVMVGDGINDAPALAAADIGVALGSRGSSASSEAAGIVLTTDRVDRLADAVAIAVRSRRIAVQSALGGMLASLAAMGLAAFGLLPPAAGALLQEGIDVAVILNALRAVRPGREAGPAVAPDTERLLRRFAAEHTELREVVEAVRTAADRLSADPGEQSLAAVRRVHRLLTDHLLPHERAEERELYPGVADALGGPEATATMSRAHTEIERLTRRIGTHLALADERPGPGGPALRPGQADDLRACLYGLHAVLRLHFAQEDENFFSLAP
ncbi:heavy metal translocating P-type ATPase [Streptomyces sp. DSM 44917]|uniref:Heavy metal translocating P-type ATPase n=1 Tax=Streptomyces boetiae TaxID=3075541 RepID=A0ABU2L888_9ACTN|nr:heavy metal translocating P-type ATPase [Streptomyces sp. DSM 44917]MDT0307513.1 heavy metal translocating P-type ATPase [Streptomyces sp. DSM 44917]